ncbi:dynein axonemal heavy chain 12-like [Schistocerca cancellata]|uniref:dynein axonemal heavy chain 12-like n=1 Tax=Schistocerca cancellata TaxID=274614 RepID=UPI002118E8AC|nr:dynein axonemal heavy chain 12-like [Schistocerca cancellata]
MTYASLEVSVMQYFMELHINHKVPMLLVGPAGTGKSFLYQNMLLFKLPKDDYAVDFITLSSKITANELQSIVVSKMVKETKGKFSAPDNKRMVILIDNMNIVDPEPLGAQPPLELLRYFLENEFWYDYEDSSKITLNDVMFVAAQQNDGANKHKISSRVLHHFNVLSINTFNENTLSRIFSNILLIALKQNGFTQEVWPTVQNMIAATIDIWQTAKSCLFATPKTPQYIFDMMDISKVMYGCSMVKRPPTAERNTFYGK